MANIDRSKKLLVRTALVTGSTVATLIGAQSLALFDQTVQMTPQAVTSTSPQTVLAAQPPTAVILHQAPSIVILRQPQSALPNVRSVVNTPAIVPPSPQISAPLNPVIIQQQAPAVSRSSR
ncbi:MAG: hypothetical protein ABI700_14260 [Chloroflexota bacterium]